MRRIRQRPAPSHRPSGSSEASAALTERASSRARSSREPCSARLEHLVHVGSARERAGVHRRDTGRLRHQLGPGERHLDGPAFHATVIPAGGSTRRLSARTGSVSSALSVSVETHDQCPDRAAPLRQRSTSERTGAGRMPLKRWPSVAAGAHAHSPVDRRSEVSVAQPPPLPRRRRGATTRVVVHLRHVRSPLSGGS